MRRLLSYSYLYLLPLLLSAILSLKAFRLGWSKRFKLFSFFLLATLSVEVFAIAWKWGLCKTRYWTYSPVNLWIYNAFLVVRQLFLFAYFFNLLYSSIVKRIIKVAAVCLSLFAIVNYFFIQHPNNVNTFTVIASNLATVIMALVFFRQLLYEDRVIQLPKDRDVWICFGTFLYYSATLPLFIFFDYLIHKHLSLALSYFYINDALNLIMYSCYLTAYLCKPQYQK